MPVTQPKKKTNFDYLKDLISDHMPKENKEEAMEFVEAIQNDFDEAKDELKSKDDELDSKQTEIHELEEEREYSDIIDTNLGSQGVIHFKVDNIACKSMMEELEAAIARGVPIIKIENILRFL